MAALVISRRRIFSSGLFHGVSSQRGLPHRRLSLPKMDCVSCCVRRLPLTEVSLGVRIHRFVNLTVPPVEQRNVVNDSYPPVRRSVSREILGIAQPNA